MEMFCPRCVTTLTELSDAVFREGSCVDCGGQLVTSTVPVSEGLEGAIALLFAHGSGVGEPFEAVFESRQLVADKTNLERRTKG